MPDETAFVSHRKYLRCPMKQPSFPIESTYDALRRYLSNLRHLREIKTFSKKLPQKFGSFTENPYICTKILKVGG